MKKFLISAALVGAIVAGASAQATILLPGTALLPTQPFSLISGTQGSLLASTSVSGTALTFSATVRAAVYRNTLGTLDFYYQVARTGPGSIPGTRGNQQIFSFTTGDFTGFGTDAYASGPDPDAAGFFTAVNNPPSSTTTFGRSSDGAVVQIAFGLNGLKTTENSATYVVRTNARAYTVGTFGVIDGSTLSGTAYAPLAVPEPEVWGLMMVGFGAVGFASRRRKTAVIS